MPHREASAVCSLHMDYRVVRFCSFGLPRLAFGLALSRRRTKADALGAQ